jgi:sialate O-acetylesterase
MNNVAATCLVAGVNVLVAFVMGSATMRPTEIATLFSDNMVLQRDEHLPVFGTAVPGTNVNVAFADQTVATVADHRGRWNAVLSPLATSATPRVMVVSGRPCEPPITIKNILVGEVWVGSGQSNMALKVSRCVADDETLQNLVIQKSYPRIRIMDSDSSVGWKEATSDNVAETSALLFAYGEKLTRELDAPVGLIVGAVGRSASGYWIPPEIYSNSHVCRDAIAKFSKTYDFNLDLLRYQHEVKVWQSRVANARLAGQSTRIRHPDKPVLPGRVFRGHVGSLFDQYIRPITGYRIRGILWDQGEADSGVPGVDQYVMMSELIRGWRELWGQGDFPFLFVQKPSGGGNAFSNDDPITRYGEPFSALPQAANLDAMSGEQRFLYVRLMRDNPNAFMVPASDLGAGNHPTNKWGYGNRAAEVALSEVYKTGTQAYGPMYRSHKVDGNKVIISYDHVGKGLIVAHSDTLQGFAVAGTDGAWHWADAKIDGESAVVWSDKVTLPTQVRYAFAANRRWANLFNKDGLPATVFSTP